jgi:hypothetical protein
MKVKFKRSGKWAEKDPALPQFTVKADEIRSVSPEMGSWLLETGRATLPEEKPVKKKVVKKKVTRRKPAHEDKARAESTPSDKEDAEVE